MKSERNLGVILSNYIFENDIKDQPNGWMKVPEL